ncbi:MAG: polyphosphate kinase 2 family protein [Bryobacteraceae bacterium]
MSKLIDQLIVRPDSKWKLDNVDPAFDGGIKSKEQAALQLKKNLDRLAVLQQLLYAENQRGVLIVLQGIDAGGKDGTIRNVMTGLNPQGCRVVSFKVPSDLEKRHDYLWRIHKEAPQTGEMVIFNRSHYEDVLVVRVHQFVPKAVWSRRYREINDFERMLSDNGVKILKFFLYISKEEQKKRFEERIENPEKNWKFSQADVEERKYWDDYMAAFEDAINHCSTAEAPWYVIPANRKWFRNLAVSEVIVQAMEKMKMHYPKPTADLSKIQFE